jgi:hypothetical protein
VPDEEALFVVIGIDESAGDPVRLVAADLSSRGMEDIDAADLHLQLAAGSSTISGSPKMTKRFPSPWFFRSSAMCRSAFIRG